MSRPRSRSGASVSGSAGSSRKREASDLVGAMASLDECGDDPRAEAAREKLRARAAETGMSLVSLTVTYDPIPDPTFDSLPPGDIKRIQKMAVEMHSRPAHYLNKLDMMHRFAPDSPLTMPLENALESATMMGLLKDALLKLTRSTPQRASRSRTKRQLRGSRS